MQIALTLKSRNAKTGPIPVSTTEAKSCPDACPLKAAGCYAASGRLGMFWNKVTNHEVGMLWTQFIDQVSNLPEGTLWRHNQAGDLPGESDFLDFAALAQLVKANTGRRGFTYTHKPMNTARNRRAVARANRNGFTVNLSANNLVEADSLAALEIGPVVVILDKPEGERHDMTTPSGRRVVTCPATYREDVTCQSCQLCQRQRDVIVGFLAHGNAKRAAAAIARS
jgi:hypothetical protein